ncbi:MAG TPA: ketoacyl-ACP synthase III [Rhodanobacteraceae bacterium]|nr:ketoacyl-ACP synthase III [Rhodanobacteraceae bacterium]
MIGIKAIGRFIAPERVSNIARSAAAGKDEAFIRDKIGFESVARLSADQETSDMCVAAFADLQRASAIRKEDVDCLIVCTQNPDAHGLPHTSAIVHKKLGLKHDVACFDISLGCSGYVYGLAVITALMQANGLRCGLLFTADPYSRIIEPRNWDTDLLFGDAATVTWIGDNPVYRCRPAMFGTDGSLGHSISVPRRGGKLSMLGSNVFKFSMTAVPDQIRRYLERESLSSDDIDVFLFHQGSRFIVENLAKKMGIAPDKVPFEAAQTGNTVSSSLPLLLQPRLEAPPPRVLMCGFGVGLSWATMVINARSTSGE